MDGRIEDKEGECKIEGVGLRSKSYVTSCGRDQWMIRLRKLQGSNFVKTDCPWKKDAPDTTVMVHDQRMRNCVLMKWWCWRQNRIVWLSQEGSTWTEMIDMYQEFRFKGQSIIDQWHREDKYTLSVTHPRFIGQEVFQVFHLLEFEILVLIFFQFQISKVCIPKWSKNLTFWAMVSDIVMFGLVHLWGLLLNGGREEFE